MLYEIMASLRFHLDVAVPELSKVQFMYDGINLTHLPKPFVTIEQLAGPTEIVSAGRTSLQETHAFQVGVFADNFGGFLKLQSRVKEALQREIAIYDEDLELTSNTFVCDISDFTPIRNADIENLTHDFHGYFDVSVRILRDVGSSEFTQ